MATGSQTWHVDDFVMDNDDAVTDIPVTNISYFDAVGNTEVSREVAEFDKIASESAYSIGMHVGDAMLDVLSSLSTKTIFTNYEDVNDVNSASSDMFFLSNSVYWNRNDCALYIGNGANDF
jgi:hypothetical protein